MTDDQHSQIFVLLGYVNAGNSVDQSFMQIFIHAWHLNNSS